jgi:hypothetical protein
MTPTNGDPSGGEQIDRAAHDAIRLAHMALERFPDLVRRHKFIAGGAAISSSLIVLAGVAIARRMRAGETPEEAVAAVTEDEVQGLHVVEPEPAEAEVDIEEAASNGETEGGPPTPVLARRVNGA